MSEAVFIDGSEPEVIPVPEFFYIQNKGFCGNCLRWWRPNGNGYTSNLNDAWRLPREEAERICQTRRGEDVMWPVADIDRIAVRHVDQLPEGRA